MPLQRWTRVIAAAGFSLAVLGSFAPAKAQEVNPAVDPRAARILKAALQNVAAAKSFTFAAEIVNEVPLDSGQRIQNIGTQTVYVRRPDRLATVYQGPDRTNSTYYDGKRFTLQSPLENIYATWDAPNTIDGLLDVMQEKLGFMPPLSALLHEDAGSGARTNEVLAGTYVGRAAIRGVECHHLAFRGENVDFQAWIAEGIPVIRRVVVTYKKRPGAPQYTATFLDWNFNPALTDYLFAFDPPPGARKIDFKVKGKP